MKFLADMGISPLTVSFLNHLGYTAVHLHQQGLDRLPDLEVVNKARVEQRIVLTHDLDFAGLLAISGANLPSVIIFRLRNMHPDHVNVYLERVIVTYEDQLNAGAIVSVTEGHVRIRLLPI